MWLVADADGTMRAILLAILADDLSDPAVVIYATNYAGSLKTGGCRIASSKLVKGGERTSKLNERSGPSNGRYIRSNKL